MNKLGSKRVFFNNKLGRKRAYFLKINLLRTNGAIRKKLVFFENKLDRKNKLGSEVQGMTDVHRTSI